MDVLTVLIDMVLSSQLVTGLVGTRVFKGSAAQIGEAQYPCVTIERHGVGIQFEAAPFADFDILVASHAKNSDLSWRLHKAVQTAIGRARWAIGSAHCTAIATTSPFDLPPDEAAEPVYPVAQIYRVRVFGEPDGAGSFSGGESIVFDTNPARDVAGTATNVPVNATATVASLIADGSFRLRGFICAGDTDGTFAIKYNGVIQFERRIYITNQDFDERLPNDDIPPAGTVVTLVVTNNGLSLGNYQGTILGA